jgi:coenzyme F420-reducing hydrogenase alpha subunit
MSGPTMRIDVHHITRVEGHGNIHVEIDDGAIRKIEWEVPESPRFFEAMVIGRHFTEVAPIVSRICGICSISHTFSSLRATEEALGVTISEKTEALRRILLWAEILQSHILHIGYLAAPDFFKVGSVLPLVASHKETVLLIVKLHRLANETADIIGGRTTHPIRTMVGGWTMLPGLREMEALKIRFEEGVEDAKKLAEVVATLVPLLPEFTRETEYICLTEHNGYAHYKGMIRSSDCADALPLSSYRRVTNEYVVAQSTAKWAKFNRESYMVGALARFNNNHGALTPTAKATALQLGLRPPHYNPYGNTLAQLVECVHALETCAGLAARLLDTGLKNENTPVTVRAGSGVGAVEAPRGILFHEYTYDDRGLCRAANCIIPTNQNHAGIQHDMEALVPRFKDRGKEQLQFMLEMLVRAYDPCISCSAH